VSSHIISLQQQNHVFHLELLRYHLQ
jgi:hypothetical protein